MTDSPEAIRADIERTRAELGSDVDALVDKVSPASIAHRQGEKIKSALGSVKERVFGADDSPGQKAAGTLSDVKDNVADAKDTLVSKAQGNPLAVGLIALGAGLLVASLIPASSAEKRVAGDIKDRAQPLVEDLKGTAKDVAEGLKPAAQDAVSSVKEAATGAAQNVKGEAQSAATDVKDQAQTARENVSSS